MCDNAASAGAVFEFHFLRFEACTGGETTLTIVCTADPGTARATASSALTYEAGCGDPLVSVVLTASKMITVLTFESIDVRSSPRRACSNWQASRRRLRIASAVGPVPPTTRRGGS